MIKHCYSITIFSLSLLCSILGEQTLQAQTVTQNQSQTPLESNESEKPDTKPPSFTILPQILPNPNLRVPLAGILSFATDEPVSTTVTVTDGEHNWKLNFDSHKKPEEGLPIIGMRPNRQHTISISIQDLAGNETVATESLRFTTPSLPQDKAEFPDLKVTVNKTEDIEPGITLVSMQRRDLKQPGTSNSDPVFGTDQDYGLLFAMDAEGEVVWYYEHNGFRITDVDVLANKNLIYLTSDFRAIEIDLLGNVINTWYAGQRPQGATPGIPIATRTLHHEINPLPNGNLMVLGTEIREIENYYTSETDPQAPRKTQSVMGDVLIEFEPDGTIVWEWNTFDHLDPFRIGYQTFSGFWGRREFPGVLDWSHGNNFIYNEEEDTILLSLRYQEAIFKIDRKTQEIIWILGDADGWSEKYQDKLFTLEGDGRWFYHQHSPEITPKGILVFDNGTFQTRPFKPPVPVKDTQSRAVEYTIDETTMTARQIWTSEVPGDEKLVDFAIGDADLLPQTGNVLIGYGVLLPQEDIDKLTWKTGWFAHGFTMMRELKRTSPPEIVWEVVIENHDPENFGGWVAPYLIRLPSLY